MNTVLEQVKQAEQDAELLLSEAKEKVAAIKADTAHRLKQMEDENHEAFKQLQLNQKEKDSTALATQISALDEQWETEKNALNKSIDTLRQDVIGALVGKVIGTYGDSSN